MYIILGSFLGALIGSLIVLMQASNLIHMRDSRAKLGKAIRSKAQQETLDQPSSDDEVTITLKYHQLRYAEVILDRLAGA